MKRKFFGLCAAVLLIACTEEPQQLPQDNAFDVAKVAALATATPDATLDGTNLGMYRGVFVSADTDFHGELIVSVSDTETPMALVALDNDKSLYFKGQALGEDQFRFKNADVDIKENELRLEKYRADIQRYEADITKEVSRIRELANTYGVDQQSYKALLDGWEAWERIGVQNKDIFINTLVEDTKLEQNKAQIELQALVSAANVRLTAAGAGVKMYENIAAGAESSLNSLVSLAQESV